MILSNKGSSILKLLSGSEGKGNIKNLAKSLELAERTIRYELDKIDDYLVSENLEPLERTFGGNIFFKDYKSFYGAEKVIPVESVVMDTHERRNYIFLKALSEEKINLTKMCEELDISRTTIKNDIKYVREELANSNISLRTFQQEGLILEGTEMI